MLCIYYTANSEICVYPNAHIEGGEKVGGVDQEFQQLVIGSSHNVNYLFKMGWLFFFCSCIYDKHFYK